MVTKRAAAKKPTGRPPMEFSQDAADTICERIALGKSLRTILAEDSSLPSMTTVFKWLANTESFAQQYARAREQQADLYAEQTVDISDEDIATVSRGDDDNAVIVFDSTAVARNRLRVDARKWYASKLAPKKYGEKVTQEVTGANGGPVNMLIGVATSDELKRHIRGQE
jgi:hypothetical protein